MKADTKKKILDVSLNLFSRYGLGNTKLADIITYSRISKATFYNYFKSKEEIFFYVMKEEMEKNDAALEKALDKEPDPRLRLKIFFVLTVNGILQILELLHIRLGEFSLLPVIPKELIEGSIRKRLDTIKGILTYGIDKGAFEVEDLELTAYVIQNSIDVFLDPFHVMRGETMTLEERADKIVAIFSLGLSKKR
jgi:AcrR family transcriptional regulator